jgi:hypothetical protein
MSLNMNPEVNVVTRNILNESSNLSSFAFCFFPLCMWYGFHKKKHNYKVKVDIVIKIATVLNLIK